MAESIPGGVVAGAGAFAAVSVIIGIGAALPLTVGLFDDDRVSIGPAEMLVKVLVVIPVGTVLLEEFAFRGVVLGLAGRIMTPMRAVAAAALAFGCWHIVTVVELIRTEHGARRRDHVDGGSDRVGARDRRRHLVGRRGLPCVAGPVPQSPRADRRSPRDQLRRLHGSVAHRSLIDGTGHSCPASNPP